MVDDSDGAGGITTQGQDLRDLQQLITEAVGMHFDDGTAPRRIRVHFVSGISRELRQCERWSDSVSR